MGVEGIPTIWGEDQAMDSEQNVCYGQGTSAHWTLPQLHHDRRVI